MQRRDVDAPELLDLQTTDTCDEAQVIVVSPHAVAVRPPCAHFALRHRLGISARVLLQRGFEAALHETVVGGEVREPVRLRIEVVMRRDHVRLGRPYALDAREQLRVHAQLQDRACARLGRELRVRDFVGPRAEPARLLDLAQEIRAAVPALAAERRLIDHVRTRAHRGQRLLDRAVVRLRIDLDDLPAAGRAQVLEVRLLVLDAALAQQHPDRIVPERLVRAAFGVSAIELAQVDATQVIREVGCGDPQELLD